MKKSQIKKRKGFTLVELVITIVIVIVLSMIAGPIYKGYGYKAKQAEGYALLGTIRSAQEAYFNEYGYFFQTKNTYTSYNVVLDIDARMNLYYTWFSVNIADKSYGYEEGFLAVVQGENQKPLTMVYNKNGSALWGNGSIAKQGVRVI